MKENTIIGVKSTLSSLKSWESFLNFRHKHERSFSEKGEQKCQYNADDDTGGEGEIEGEGVPFDMNISGKSADPRDLVL